MPNRASPESISVGCERRNLATVRRFVEHALAERQVAPRVAGQLLVAVDEVCANIIIHGNQEDPAQQLTVSLQAPAGEVVFELFDHGVPFEGVGLQQPDLQQYVRDRRKGGLGLTLVYLIMDEVEFLRAPGGGNLTRLTKHLG